MAKHELEAVELTNMCAIIDEENHRVLVQERIKSWKGVTFPGGHVEVGEALVPSTIREIKEETGLTVDHLKLAGIKDWYEPNKKRRYMVFLYATKDYSGNLIEETEEGKVFWLPIEKLKSMKLSQDFAEMADMMLGSELKEAPQAGSTEFWYDIKGPGHDLWKKKFF